MDSLRNSILWARGVCGNMRGEALKQRIRIASSKCWRGLLIVMVIGGLIGSIVMGVALVGDATWSGQCTRKESQSARRIVVCDHGGDWAKVAHLKDVDTLQLAGVFVSRDAAVMRVGLGSVRRIESMSPDTTWSLSRQYPDTTPIHVVQGGSVRGLVLSTASPLAPPFGEPRLDTNAAVRVSKGGSLVATCMGHPGACAELKGPLTGTVTARCVWTENVKGLACFAPGSFMYSQSAVTLSCITVGGNACLATPRRLPA